MPNDIETTGPGDRLASALRALHARAGAPSTRSLAQAIGTSHTTVAEILAGKRRSSWSTVRELVHALDGVDEEFADLWLAASGGTHQRLERPSDDFGPYRRQVSAYASSLELGAPYERVRAPFTQLYVLPRLKEVRTGHETDIWALSKHLGRVVVLGEPGSGKTTFCQAVTLRSAGDPDQPVPFTITLRNFANTGAPVKSVVGFIEQTLESWYQVPVQKGAVARMLSAGRALVMFDGLDEVAEPAARDVASIIELFTRQFPLAQVLVTSRLVGYDRAQLDSAVFDTYHLLPFTEEQAAMYVRRWFGAMPLSGLSEEDRALRSQEFIDLSKQMPDVNRSPLLLSFAAQQYASTSVLPLSRAALVGRSVRLMLKDWDRSRGVESADSHLPVRLERALGYLAYRSLDSARPRLGRDELIGLLADSLEELGATRADAELSAASTLISLLERSSLFSEVGLDTAGQPIYQFSNRTFLDYLAGERLIHGSKLPQQLAQRLPDPNWHLAIDFAFELLSLGSSRADETLAAQLAAAVVALPPERAKSAAEFLSARSRRLLAMNYPHSDVLAAQQYALALYRELKDKISEALVLKERGQLLIAASDYDAAINALHQAAEIFRDMGDKPGLATVMAAIETAQTESGA